MERHNFNGKRAAKRAALFLLLLFSLCAAVFGFYRIADAVLSRMLPPAAESAPSRTVSRSVQPAFSSSKADSGGAAYVPIKGLFASNSALAQAGNGKMPVKEKVGQVFLFTCPSAGAVKAIDDYQPGGYVLTGRDFKGRTAAEVKKTLASYQNSSRIPMLLACDEEGGTVVRVSSNSALSAQKFRSPQEVFRLGGMDGITADAEKKAELMKSLGLNLNLAPVCDVSVNPSDFIYARSFGQNAQRTAEFAAASVKAYRGRNFSCVLKHFPGYGNNGDTHEDVVRDARSYQTFQRYDFLPFEAGIQAGAPCVMVSHSVVECMDAKNPASLSPQVHHILRDTLGFSGAVMTDDLSMKGVSGFLGEKNAAVAAFLAGNDLLLTPDLSGSFRALYNAVRDGTVSGERLDESVLRILAWKYSTGLLS